MAPQAWASAQGNRLLARYLFTVSSHIAAESPCICFDRPVIVKLVCDLPSGSNKAVLGSAFRSKDDSKENHKMQRPGATSDSDGKPAAGMKSKVQQCFLPVEEMLRVCDCWLFIAGHVA